MAERILIISVHPVLEYDERKLFSEIGFECFSLGFFSNFDGSSGASLRRAFEESDFTANCRDRFMRTGCKIVPTEKFAYSLSREFAAYFDIIVVHHNYEFISHNWEAISDRLVVWRTIGQELGFPDQYLSPFRDKGLKIVRWSPQERHLEGYIGADAIIRAAKDNREFLNWKGGGPIICFTNNFLERSSALNYDFFRAVADAEPIQLFGVGNEGIPEWSGLATYPEQLQLFSRATATFLTGTWPAPYTLGFVESWMAGAPVVHIGKAVWAKTRAGILFEVDQLIENGINGFIANSETEAVSYLRELNATPSLAKDISTQARFAAERYFGWSRSTLDWLAFFSDCGLREK